MNRAWVVDVVDRLPQALLSRGWGWLARRRRPRFAVSLLKHAFVGATGIDLRDAGTSVGSYDTLEALFVRHLRPGARRIDPDPSAIISPVDGTVGACGTVQADTLLQIKGRRYNLSRLLDDADAAARFEGGPYATLYLAPHNYHRIHTPLSGEVREAVLVPGGLMPVFPASLEKVDELFARNERIITYIDTPAAGRLAVVKVGATLVGRIGVTYDPDLVSNVAGELRRRVRYNPPKLVNKGAELGVFGLGSTVVLIGEPGRVHFDSLQLGAAVTMGQRVGSLAESKRRRRSTAARASASSAPSKTKATTKARSTGSAPPPRSGRAAGRKSTKQSKTAKSAPPSTSAPPPKTDSHGG